MQDAAMIAEEIARFVEGWNGSTRDGDTVLIAQGIRDRFILRASANWNIPSDMENTEDFVAAVKVAADLYSAAELAVWLTAPQPLLNNWTPIQLLGCGKAAALRRVMQSIEDGCYI